MALIIVLQNITALAPISDYTYRVLVGDGGPDSQVITGGYVRGHQRSDGWEVLVDRLLEDARSRTAALAPDGDR